ncbi:hypothetical protein, partial [Chloroflexus sp.]|uniref:hypothetical protein n=1 Tax=Chloroflexus sp. TaxID=1904827 RepID=UPI00257EE7DF
LPPGAAGSECLQLRQVRLGARTSGTPFRQARQEVSASSSARCGWEHVPPARPSTRRGWERVPPVRLGARTSGAPFTWNCPPP